MTHKTNLIINMTDPDGNPVTKAVTNINPKTGSMQFAAFGQAIAAVTDNTFKDVSCVVTATGANNSAGFDKDYAKFTLTWKGETYESYGGHSSDAKFTVLSTDPGVVSLGDHKYWFIVPGNYLDASALITGETSYVGTYCGLGSFGGDKNEFGVLVFIDATDANKEDDATNWDEQDGVWKVFFGASSYGLLHTAGSIVFAFKEV